MPLLPPITTNHPFTHRRTISTPFGTQISFHTITCSSARNNTTQTAAMMNMLSFAAIPTIVSKPLIERCSSMALAVTLRSMFLPTENFPSWRRRMSTRQGSGGYWRCRRRFSGRRDYLCAVATGSASRTSCIPVLQQKPRSDLSAVPSMTEQSKEL